MTMIETCGAVSCSSATQHPFCAQGLLNLQPTQHSRSPQNLCLQAYLTLHDEEFSKFLHGHAEVLMLQCVLPEDVIELGGKG